MRKTNDDVKEKETKIMKDAKLQAMFDSIVANFDPNDRISVENANHEMHKNWQKFLEAGFDVDLVAKMLSLADIWKHYNELTSYGAKIDMTKWLNDFVEESFEDDFAAKHWDELVARGVSPDSLVDRIYDEYLCDIDYFKDILAKGVTVKKIFELAREWLEVEIAEFECFMSPVESPVDVLVWFFDNGIPKDSIKELLIDNINDDMDEYAIEYNLDFYKNFDMDIDAAINRWVKTNGRSYFNEYSLTNLPKVISVDKFINSFSIDEIIENCSPYDFTDFVEDYLSAGQDINTLAQKFMDEIGYSADSCYSMTLLNLVEAGTSTEIIDPAEYIESIDMGQLSDYVADNWREFLDSQS